MASLKKLAIQSTGTMIVKDAKGREVEDENGKWSITFVSPGTKQFQKALHKFNETKSGGFLASLKGNEKKSDPDADNQALAEFLADVTVSFNGFDYEGKTGWPAFKAAFADLEIGHIAEQANEYLGKRGNFLPPSATDSADMSAALPG